MKRKCVFLDRDGTIAFDVPYCSRTEDFHLIPGAAEAIRTLNQHGFLVVLVTNQSGISRGYFTESTLIEIHQKMEQLLSDSGARIDAIYFCPHHPEDGCKCRKPNIGMIDQAMKDFALELSGSYVIGDAPSDIELAHAIGCKSVLIRDAPPQAIEGKQIPTHVAATVRDAVHWMIQGESSPS
jgi:histidinol-phosphate phosphatase family protein